MSNAVIHKRLSLSVRIKRSAHPLPCGSRTNSAMTCPRETDSNPIWLCNSSGTLVTHVRSRLRQDSSVIRLQRSYERLFQQRFQVKQDAFLSPLIESLCRLAARVPGWIFRHYRMRARNMSSKEHGVVLLPRVWLACRLPRGVIICMYPGSRVGKRSTDVVTLPNRDIGA
jgi:hypothetical protein